MMIGALVPSAKLWGDMMRMGIEAQFVMTLRTAGMLGLLPHGKNENTLMVSEKTDAVRESFGAAFRSAARGARADQILAAALKPYGRRTRANARRLGTRL
ncbi:antibiotic ABC transporter [Paracoccus sp. MC1862]|nr:antibiotic ABC transporter [Paracoccus sp. MC1862]QQO46519.1 antibiotic ABC transporter [Paracoccus sp. MC1862]